MNEVQGPIQPREEGEQGQGSSQEIAVPQAISPQMLDRMLENQAREIQIRAQELALQQQKDTNAFEFGKGALTAKVADRRDQRTHEKSMRRDVCFLVGFLTLLIVGLIAYALFSKSEAFATELVKSLVFIFSGGAGGYGLAKARDSKSAPSSTSEDDD